jgi:SpoVK/Ycf46/Vps4 family AAA+-type ATPase
MDKNEVLPDSTPDKRRSLPQDDKPVFTAREPRFALDRDVVLPASTRVQLQECIAKIDHHRQIYVEWGFEAVDPMGRSTILNFYGPPGTGKTLAAEAFAGSLGMPFVSVGIAEVESKYMGETSKNLQAVFRTARELDAVLFFDEADTLLGKRLSSVTQGIDNEVNAMRSTLLIELERFDGITIFATNFAKNYDEAFRSRISHHVHFDLPDSPARQGIFSRMLVAGIPLEGDRAALIVRAAELSEGMSGRDIRTCMRLALPKAIVAGRQSGTPARLSITHIEGAIDEVSRARRDVASSGSSFAKGTVSDAKKLLGIES